MQELSEYKGVLIHLADIPFVKKVDITKIMTEAHNSYYKNIIIPKFNDKNGHPLFIPKEMLHKVLFINEKSEGLRGFLNQSKSEILSVECSEGILKDIDFKSDLS